MFIFILLRCCLQKFKTTLLCLKKAMKKWKVQFYLQLVYKAAISFTLRIQILILNKKIHFSHFKVIPLFGAGATMFSFKILSIKHEKIPSKVGYFSRIQAEFPSFQKFCLKYWAAQPTQTVEFLLSNVAYRATVHTNGVEGEKKENPLFWIADHLL